MRRRDAIQHKRVKANKKTPVNTKASANNVHPHKNATPPTKRTVNPITTDKATKSLDEPEKPVTDASEDISRPTPRALVLYLCIAIIVTVIVYFGPEPFLIAVPTASVSAVLLTWLGVPSGMVIDWLNSAVLVVVIGFQEFQIVRECTGIQVIAVFAGLILPLPRGTWLRKILALLVVTIMLFIANVLRVVYEIWLVFWGILPWEIAHYPMSFVLGVVGVFVLCIVAILLVPGFIETFEDMIYYLFPPKPTPKSNFSDA